MCLNSSQHSWKWFIYYRRQIVNRHTPVGPSRKRFKLGDRAHAHFYPPTKSEDDVSYEHNLELLKTEMAKGKPRVDVLRDLMRRTFPN